MKTLLNYEVEKGAFKETIKVWKTKKGFAVERFNNDWDDENYVKYYTELPTLPTKEELESPNANEEIANFLDTLRCDYTEECYRTVIDK